ncbi:uncharacterized protein PAC_02242 [Phialocephala subalpina]|uniref:Roadblock/LAMTOR2 domain-containing protein n=1 Tax=Phialocephala subalpina TaxID=576137 RepID=A0A1L7WHW5_9HELO|nr:uncharacterized protein PAC_02242 [Phialocephala subalpina]
MPYIFPPPPPTSQFLTTTTSNTMLLNKRLTTFLSQNTTPQLPTLLLLSPTGKLLTSSSPLSATALRTQATLACSLWVLYQPSIPSLISSSLPNTSNNENGQGRNGTRGSDSSGTVTEHELSTITIQLEKGIMVIRQLGCGLLFVAIGSPPTAAAQGSPRPSSHQLSHASPPSSPPAQAGNGEADGFGEGNSLIGRGSAAASEAGSVRSVGGTRTGIMGVRRRADEVGKWLDGQLEGFVLRDGEGR